MKDIEKISREKFIKIISESYTRTDVCRKIELELTGKNKKYYSGQDIKSINNLIKEYKCNIDHFNRYIYHKRYAHIEKECPVCGNKFKSADGSKKHKRKFCSRGCSNKFRAGIRYSTKLNPDRYEIKIYKCLNCDKEIINTRFNRNSKKKFCSHDCFGQYQRKLTFERIENGTFKRMSRGNGKNNQLKLYLIEKHGYKCMICELTEWMGHPIPLQLDHIDGDSDNDDVTNIRNVCPNCHAQTPTYCGKNKGNGKRKYRMKDYLDGKKNW